MPVLALSGGLDSTVLGAVLIAEYGTKAVVPVFFHYGSKHNVWEAEAARRVAGHYGLELFAVDLAAVFARLNSALLAHDRRDIPRVAYAKENIGLTLVPGRNLIFVSILAALAEDRGLGAVALATHAGDHYLYPDCRAAFNESLARTVLLGSDGAVELLTPFSGMDKAAVVRLGLSLEAPFGLTRSCYENRALSCGQCGTCRERLEAFARNGTADPLLYGAENSGN